MCVALPLTVQESGHDGSHTIPLGLLAYGVKDHEVERALQDVGLWVSSIGHPNGLYNSLFGVQMEKTGHLR